MCTNTNFGMRVEDEDGDPTEGAGGKGRERVLDLATVAFLATAAAYTREFGL